MLFDRLFRRELSRSFGVALVVLLTIVMTMTLIRTLSQAAGGRVAPQDVLLLLGYLSLNLLPIVLTLALFIGIVATLGRAYRDSEMAVWHACGVPLRQFAAPTLRMAAPIVLAVAALVMLAWPWGAEQSAQLRQRYEGRSDLSRVAPGQFQASRDGSKVFFIERDSERPAVGRNVFILSQQGQRESVTTAGEGEIVWDDDDRMLVLRAGQRAETDARSGEHSFARFEQYRVVADRQLAKRLDELPPEATSTLALIKSTDKRRRGELCWRLGMVLGTVNFVLLGIGLSATNPRRPSNWSLLLGLLVFVVYFNLIKLSAAWVAQGKLDIPAALLAVHGPALLMALLLMVWRDEAIRIGPRAARRAAT